MKKFVLCFLLILLLSSVFCQEETIIVESRMAGKNYSSYKELSGTWFDSTAKSIAPGLSPATIGSRFVSVKKDSEEAEARFTPDIKVVGLYEISVTWGRSANANHVKYVVNINGQVHFKYLDQVGWGSPDSPSNKDEWIPLGTFSLPKGKKTWVAVQTADVNGIPNDQNVGRVYADAVRFVHLQPGGQKSSPSVQPGSTAPTQSSLVPQSTPYSRTATNTSPFYTAKTPTSQIQQNQTTGIPTPVQNAIPSGTVNWLNNYYQAVQTGTSSQKPILLFFKSNYSKFSKNLEQQMFTTPQVLSILSRYYVCCKINITQNKKLNEYYGVFKAPTLIFLDKRGYSKARLDNITSPSQLATALERNRY